ncbi:MAG: DUF4384 domain-containing protein [Candidatus Melainabacteria bacterium]|nr:DUF4384 domain-containing protein [Candidatus Melainabacteria bacterium]
MNTKGANLLLLSTLLIASCSAAPAFADDTAKETVKAAPADTKALPADAPDESKAPKTPTKDDMKNVGDNRGIIIKSLTPSLTPVKSVQTGKVTTAENKGTSAPRVKNVMNDGSHVFGKGLFIEQKNAPNRSTKLGAPARVTTTTTTTTTSKNATSTAIHKSTNEPLQVKTVKTTTKTQPIAKVIPAKSQPVVATKSTASSTKTIHVNAGEQIVTAWLNKKGDKPHFKDGERLQVNVAANKDCNLMIFNYDGEQLTQLYPNEYQNNPFVKAGQTIEVGGEGCKFDFTAANSTSKVSNEKIFVYAYPLESDSSPISIAMAKVPSSPFRAAEMTPERYRELVNRSEVFFSRKVNVTAKKGGDTEEVQLASFEQQSQPTAAPNKIELHLVIEPNKR